MTKTTIKRTKNFGDVIRQKMAADPDLQERVDAELFSIDVATLIFNARKDARLTQAELAHRVGTSQSVIARLEDADYEGHSLKMLKRLAEALDCRLGIEFYKRAAPVEAISTVKSHEMVWPDSAGIEESEINEFASYPTDA